MVSILVDGLVDFSPRGAMNSIPLCIFGGTGVFGRIIVEELLKSPMPFRITVASRDEAKFKRTFSSLSDRLTFCPLELRDLNSVGAVLQGQKIMILAAGPFQELSPEIAGIAAGAGVHYLDLCDWPPYFFALQQWTKEFSEAGVACLPGLSTLPGISIPLFCVLQSEFDELEEVRIGLFIGNKNPKGFAAMASALRIESSSRFVFPFPQPIGSFPAFSLATPDIKIIPMIASCHSIQVGVSFEWSLARGIFSLMRNFFKGGKAAGMNPLLSFFSPALNLLNFFGTRRGCVSIWVRGRRKGEKLILSSSLYAPSQSQRIAALPSVIAAEALARGECKAKGWLLPHEWMEPKVFLNQLIERGLEYKREAG
jgi:saccharopine dehydrogenase-like NADP-dependent oxidoreductase